MAGILHRRIFSSMAACKSCRSLWRLPQVASAVHGSNRTLPRRSIRTLKMSAGRFEPTSSSSQPPKNPKSETRNSTLQEIMESGSSRKSQLTPAEKVVEAGKDASYSLAGIFGLGMIGAAAFFLVKDEFGSGQPSAIFRRSLRIVKKDKEVAELVGAPYKAYGYSSDLHKGWRNHVHGVDYLMGANEDLYRQVKYFIKGKQRKAVVTVDMKEKKKGSKKFDYYTINVEVPGMRPILVLDRRYSDISLASYEESD